MTNTSLASTLTDRPRLANELRVTLTRRIALAAFCVTMLAFGLHIGWSIYQRNTLQNRLRDALAHSLQEPLRSHNLPATHAILQAFAAGSTGTRICVKLPSGDWLKEPDCGVAPFETYSLNLSKDHFEVSVTLPIQNPMVLFGVPFALAILAIFLLVSQYLKAVSKRVLNDLDRLASSRGSPSLHYQELAQAAGKIMDGFRLQEENLKMAADARIGAIAELAGHDIRAPLETLKVLASEVADQFSSEKREVFESVTLRIGAVANDLLQVSSGAIGAPFAGDAVPTKPVVLASVVEAIVKEKRVLFQNRVGLQLLVEVEPTASSFRVDLSPRAVERVLSNLINNAVEAIDGPGTIAVLLSRRDTSAELLIRDTGRGIPADILGRLAKKGETFGKVGGTGLGLFHAKERTEAWGGQFGIASEPGVGTTLRLQFKETVTGVSPGPLDLVLIDGTRVVHEGWRLIANEKGLHLAGFLSAEHLLADLPTLDRDVPIYVDKNGVENGLEVGERLAGLGFHNIHLTTGERPPDSGPPPGFRSVVGKGFPRRARMQGRQSITSDDGATHYGAPKVGS